MKAEARTATHCAGCCEAAPAASTRGASDSRAADDMRRLGAALALALAAEALALFGADAMPWTLLGMALAVGAIALGGFAACTRGFAALRRGRLSVDALMAVAVTGAFLIGDWPEAAMVMALYAIAEAIEERSAARARRAITSLMALAPDEAEVRQRDGSHRRLPIAEVALDAVVRVRPGERLPLDGVIVAGTSAIDQSPVTGESIPVDKRPGDAVFAGSINQSATLELRVTARAADSTLARIIRAVEQAQSRRAPTQRFVDRFAAIYTPAVFAAALAVALIAPFALDWSWTQAIYRALVLLVIACPCALVLSTPVTVVSGLAAAARRGILVKGGVWLEEARRLKAVALDKTGTLTEGRPSLTAFEVLDASRDARDAIAARAKSLAAHSDHPVAKAIAAGLDGVGELPLEDFRAIGGRGVQARIGGDVFLLGNRRFVDAHGLGTAGLEARLREHEAQGRSVSLLASQGRVLALFAVADAMKPSSRAACQELRALGVAPVLLSGDNPTTVAAIARQAGIDDAVGGLLPEDKLEAVRKLQARFGPTAMAGDGINDAPALAAADIGVAMGAAGTDIAMEAADVVVMNDDLRRIPETIRLSRRTHALLMQNIGIALGIKAAFLALALAGTATMWMAVFADMGASLIVVANGLRLLRGAAPAVGRRFDRTQCAT